MNRGSGVADGALGVLAGLLDGCHRVLKVARIVQSVEHAEHVHAVFGRLLDKLVDDLVVVVAVAQKVLATQQHLQPGVRQQLAESTQTLPWVFVEESDARIEGSSTPAFNGPEACHINVGTGINHVLHGHASGKQALMRVAEHELGNANLSWTHESNLCTFPEAFTDLGSKFHALTVFSHEAFT